MLNSAWQRAGWPVPWDGGKRPKISTSGFSSDGSAETFFTASDWFGFRSDGAGGAAFLESLVGGRWARDFETDGLSSSPFFGRASGDAAFSSDGVAADEYIGRLRVIGDGCLSGTGVIVAAKPRNFTF